VFGLYRLSLQRLPTSQILFKVWFGTSSGDRRNRQVWFIQVKLTKITYITDLI
jgi:hypothetical protein